MLRSPKKFPQGKPKNCESPESRSVTHQYITSQEKIVANIIYIFLLFSGWLICNLRNIKFIMTHILYGVFVIIYYQPYATHLARYFKTIRHCLGERKFKAWLISWKVDLLSRLESKWYWSRRQHHTQPSLIQQEVSALNESRCLEKSKSPEWDQVIDLLAAEITTRHYSRKTLRAYADWFFPARKSTPL